MKPYQITFAVIMLIALGIKGYKMYAEHKRIPIKPGMVWDGYYNIIRVNHPPRYEGFRIIKNIEGLVKILNMENVKLPFRGERIDEAKAYIDGLVYSKNKMQSQL